MDYFSTLLGIGSFLIAMLVPLLNAQGGVEIRRVLAWCMIVTSTLIIPAAFLTWGVMHILVRVLTPNTSDILSFVTQTAWSVGAFSALYPLLWGVKFYPRFEFWLSNLLSLPAGKEKKITKYQPKRRK